MTINIIYDDKIRAATILTKGSQHPQFPAEDCQVDALLQPYRSRHGTDSGNGLFVIDSDNKYIDFDETAGELTATLTEGNYTAQTLCIEIKTQMDAAGATYTVTYSESTGKFTIAKTAGNFSLLWKTGTHGSDNTDTHTGTTLGYSDAADDNGGAGTFTGDYVRIHWPKAFIDFDLGAAYAIDFLAVLAHNISASATLIRFTGATDSGISANLATEDLTHASGSIHKFPSSAVTKQYWRFEVHDPTNIDGYIEWGRLLVAIKWQPNRDFVVPFRRGRMDPSDRYRSDAQVLYSSEKSILKSGSLPFEGLTDANKILAHAFMDVVGLTKGFILCFDPDNPNDDTLWVANTALNSPENRHYNYWAWMLDYMELK